MKIAILSNGTGNYSTKRLKEVAKLRVVMRLRLLSTESAMLQY
jgi:hypothetical protein